MAHIIPIQHLGVYRSAEEVSRDQSFGSWNARTGGASVTGWFCDPNSWHCHGIVPLKCGKKEAIVTKTSYYISGIKKIFHFQVKLGRSFGAKLFPEMIRTGLRHLSELVFSGHIRGFVPFFCHKAM